MKYIVVQFINNESEKEQEVIYCGDDFERACILIANADSFKSRRMYSLVG